MAIDEFELFHGVVLTKLVRSERPVTLRMIETHPDEAWSAYMLNDEVHLFVKHSTNPRRVADGEGRSWTFVFGADQVRQMGVSKARGGVYIALVGASRQVKDPGRCVCLLSPEQIKELLTFSPDAPQTITVRLLPRKKLRVYKARRERFKVPQNRLEQWEVPGA